MVWKKYNGRIAAVCILIFLLCVTGLSAGRGTEYEEAQKEQHSDTTAEQERETPAPVVVEPDTVESVQVGSGVEPDIAEPTQAGSGVEQASEMETPDAAEVEHDFGPVSYDLTDLPPMENERYAEWEGNIYYRQYSDEDMEDGGLWADFMDVPGTAKELMCMEPDGSVTQVGVDYGCDELYIVNGRIYSSKDRQFDDDGREVNHGGVYSCALDGNDVREYDSYRILDVQGERIICETDGDGLVWIDGRDGQEHVLIPENDSYHGAEYLGATEEEVFLYQCVRNDSEEYGQPYDVTLYSVDYQGKEMDLATVTLQEYATECVSEESLSTAVFASPLFISCLQIMGDDLYFSVGTTNGTAHVYSGGMIYSVKRDGSGLTRLADKSTTERFYLYDDGVNRSLYGKLADEDTLWELDGMQPIVLRGEAVDGIVPRDAIRTEYERPDSYVSENGADEILYYPDTSGICYVLLTSEESEELGIRTHVDENWVQQITDIEYLSGRLFFTVTDLTYSKEYSIGWRDGYERGRSVCYCKDMESGEIRALYEY